MDLYKPDADSNKTYVVIDGYGNEVQETPDLTEAHDIAWEEDHKGAPNKATIRVVENP